VSVPATYKALFNANVLETKTRHEVEQRYARVSRVPSKLFDAGAIALVLLGPALVAGAWMRIAEHPPSAIDLFTRTIIPALLPGTALWMWSAAIHATIVRFHTALAARAPKDTSSPPCCRSCGAPLEVAKDAIFARCAYCGTDSLVTQLADALAVLDEALRRELKTMAEAVTALLYRRRLVLGGVAITVTVLAALIALLRASL
jgi:hypothetical protein